MIHASVNQLYLLSLLFDINRLQMQLKGIQAQEYRFALILKLREEGRTQGHIEEIVSCTQAWVSKVLSRYKGLDKRF